MHQRVKQIYLIDFTFTFKLKITSAIAICRSFNWWLAICIRFAPEVTIIISSVTPVFPTWNWTDLLALKINRNLRIIKLIKIDWMWEMAHTWLVCCISWCIPFITTPFPTIAIIIAATTNSFFTCKCECHKHYKPKCDCQYC